MAVGEANVVWAAAASRVAGSPATAEQVALARAQSASVADADDRAILESDLASLA